METITIIEPYILHQVDRDPTTGMYGEGNIFYTDTFGDLVVASVDAENSIIKTTDGRSFEVTEPPSRNFFNSTLVARWHRIKHRFVDDEDYTDYQPGFYSSLENLHLQKLEIVD